MRSKTAPVLPFVMSPMPGTGPSQSQHAGRPREICERAPVVGIPSPGSARARTVGVAALSKTGFVGRIWSRL